MSGNKNSNKVWQPRIAVGIAGGDEPFVAINGEVVPVEMILKVARDMDIPVVRDEALAQQLSSLDLDEEIPPEFLEAVEKSLRFLNTKKDRGTENSHD